VTWCYDYSAPVPAQRLEVANQIIQFLIADLLAEPVVTSGRNLRTHSFWSMARLLTRLALRGADGFCDRRGLDLWYRPLREKTQ
jgi:hypothetical protein